MTRGESGLGVEGGRVGRRLKLREGYEGKVQERQRPSLHLDPVSSTQLAFGWIVSPNLPVEYPLRPFGDPGFRGFQFAAKRVRELGCLAMVGVKKCLECGKAARVILGIILGTVTSVFVVVDVNRCVFLRSIQ